VIIVADTSVSYKCPKCGAPLTFLPGHDKVTCEFCGSEYTIAEIEKLFAAKDAQAATASAKEAANTSWDTSQAGTEWQAGETDKFQTFVCSSCGAELVTDGNTMATECVYCGNPTMLPQRFDGSLKPDFIIPFKKTKEEAVAALKAFYEGKKLLPDAFTANNRVEAIQSLYVPFWLFDSKVHALFNYDAVNYKTYQEGDDDVKETQHYNCVREADIEFKKIPADGSKKMDDDYMDSIEPFNYEEMVPFTTAYLTGHLADKYDVTAEDSAPRAAARVTSSTKAIMDASLKYDNFNATSSSISKTGGDVKYAMVPVWILTTKFDGKPYTFMMNGQTGKFIGSLPTDKSKENKYMAMAFGAVLVAAVIIINVVSKLL
jgi:DNA-directed RNA polymerase subunit RPC12/RpoP